MSGRTLQRDGSCELLCELAAQVQARASALDLEGVGRPGAGERAEQLALQSLVDAGSGIDHPDADRSALAGMTARQLQVTLPCAVN